MKFSILGKLFRRQGSLRPSQHDEPSQHGEPSQHDESSQHDKLSQHDEPSHHDEPSQHDDVEGKKTSVPLPIEVSRLPTWFIDNCVKTPAELDSVHIPLVVRGLHTLEAQSHTRQSDHSDDTEEISFQVDSVVYEALYTALATCGQASGKTRPNTTRPFFEKEHISLALASRTKSQGGPAFLQSLLEHFARDIRGTLMTLCLEDIEELALLFLGMGKSSLDECLKLFFSTSEDAPDGKYEFPFQMLLNLSRRKTTDPERRSLGSISTTAPLIVHVPNVHQFKAYYYPALRRNILDALHATISKIFQDSGDVLMISSSCFTSSYDDDSHEQILVVPVRSTSQMRLLDKGLKDTDCIQRHNIRKIQKHIRGSMVELAAVSEPYADWTFLDGAQGAKTILNDRKLSKRDAICFAELINRCVDINHIPKAIEDGHLRMKLLDNWDVKDENDGWTSFPVSIQTVIREIEKDPFRYEWEKKCLDLLVRPDSVDEGWSDIEMDEEAKCALIQVVNRPASTGGAAYGILKKSRVGGALLYGPPGTGKTHLARVLARESQATLISVSTADIVTAWVGDTEKAIKALFNLGRMIAPSIIFFDEADSLFQARGSNDFSWDRSRVNQLLTEMDGLIRIKHAPFVLLATNFPSQLDHAVLRRAPFRIHMGLPSIVARERIFRICLREEKLSHKVDFKRLSKMTQGYSGSDIQTACTQAALIAEHDAATSEPQQSRIIDQECFERALSRTTPSVSRGDLCQIQEFARDHDPSTWSKMGAATYNEEHHSPPGAPNPYDTRVPSENIKKGKPSVRCFALYEFGVKDGAESTAAACEEVPNRGSGNAQEAETPLPDGKHSGYASTSHARPIYRPLLNSKHIRVLSISNDGSGPETIRCTLETVSLDDCTPTYLAISSQLEDLHTEIPGLHPLNLWQSVTARPANVDFETWQRSFIDRFIWQHDAGWDVPMEEMGKLEPRWNWGDYIALSYVWGDSTGQSKILVNGKSFLVNRSLFQALVKLRESFENTGAHLKVWIDAICINQADMKEREVEVKKMDLIYSKALAVRGWIGSPSMAAAGFAAATSWMDEIRHLGVSEMSRAPVPNGNTADALVTLASTLFGEPYWDRCWIMQEIALAPSLMFWYGGWRFNCDDLLKLYRFVRDVTLMNPNSESARTWDVKLASHLGAVCLRLGQLRGVKNSWRHLGTPPSLIVFIDLAQSSKATDQRDKVYGMLGILPSRISDQIQPDYSSSPDGQKAYTLFSKACILSEGGLNTLARRMAYPSRLEDIPSWAFDLSSRDIRTGTSNTIALKRHEANKGRERVPEFSQDSRTMFCEGIFVDTIASIGATIRISSENEIERDSMHPESLITADEAGLCHLPVDERVKLALARVFCQDSNYSFVDGPSLLDVPWETLSNSGPEDQNVHPSMAKQEIRYTPIKKQASTTTEAKSFQAFRDANFFQAVMHQNATFAIGGICLRQYFTAKNDFHSRPEHYSELIGIMFGLANNRRLCTTTNGLIGMAPMYARLGDRVAVLSCCDMPVVLRQRGEDFEFVGGCFMEGLMKGEAIEKLNDGQLEVENISIC